jgi:hypothetical protein
VSRAGKIAWIVVGVLVLAFFAARLISPDDSVEEDQVSYREFVERIPVAGEVESVEIDEYDGVLEVTPGPRADDDEEYEVGYLTDSGESLTTLLDQNEIPYEVRTGSGGSIVSWFFYLLPAALFGAFWFWLSRRLNRLDSSRD